MGRPPVKNPRVSMTVSISAETADYIKETMKKHPKTTPGRIIDALQSFGPSPYAMAIVMKKKKNP